MTDPTNDRLNPKAAIGATKPPLHLVPASFIAATAIGLYEGKLKYGRANWRATDVSASTYVRAALNHITKWFEGQDADPESTVKELFYAAANLAILIDAEQAGTLVDDRQYPGNYAGMEVDLMAMMRRLEELYGDRDPQHYDRRLVAGPDTHAAETWADGPLTTSMQEAVRSFAAAGSRIAAAMHVAPQPALVPAILPKDEAVVLKTREEIQALFPNSVIAPVEPEGDSNAQS